MAKRPHPLHIAFVDRGLDLDRKRRHGSGCPRGYGAGGLIAFRLELDQQHRLECIKLPDTDLVRHQLKKSPVQHLHRRRAVVEEGTNGVGQLVERRERHPKRRGRGGNAVETPGDACYEGGRAFRADNQVEQVPRLEPGVEGVATGILPGVREAASDERLGGTDGGPGITLEPAHRRHR